METLKKFYQDLISIILPQLIGKAKQKLSEPRNPTIHKYEIEIVSVLKSLCLVRRRKAEAATLVEHQEWSNLTFERSFVREHARTRTFRALFRRKSRYICKNWGIFQ